MNKKHKLANKKHRKTKNRLKLLRDASLAKVKKKIIKPKEKPIAKVEKAKEDAVVKKSTKKKTTATKSTKKKTTAKKSTAKK